MDDNNKDNDDDDALWLRVELTARPLGTSHLTGLAV